MSKMPRESSLDRRSGPWSLAPILLLVVSLIACDEKNDDNGGTPDADADANADADADPFQGLGYGEHCVLNNVCASSMCLILEDLGVSNCTIECQSDADCAAMAGWTCGDFSGKDVCLPPEPEIEAETDAGTEGETGADADAEFEGNVDGCPDKPIIAGGVTVYELIFPLATLNRGNASTHFGEVSAGGEDPVPVHEDEICATYVGENLEFDTEPKPSLDAGTIQISGAKTMVTMTRDAFDKKYRSSLPTDNADLFDAGQTIRFEAEGGEDIAAAALEAPTPVAVRVTAPLNASNLSRSAPLTVSWTPADGGAITALITAYVEDGGGNRVVTSILCGASDGDGQLVVAAEHLAHLPAEAANAGYTVTRARAAGETRCELGLALTVSTTYGGYLKLVP